MTLVLAGSRLVRGGAAIDDDAETAEVVDTNDRPGGIDLDQLLGEGRIARAGIDDRGDAAVAEAQGRGDILAGGAGRYCRSLDGADGAAGQMARQVDEMAHLAQDPSVLLVRTR